MAVKTEVLRQLERIPDDEPLFLLRAQDLVAHIAVAFWCDRAKEVGATAEKVDEAFDACKAMIDFKNKHPRRVKVPD